MLRGVIKKITAEGTTVKELIGQLSMLIAFMAFLGTAGTIETESTIPESTIVTAVVSAGYMIIYMLVKYMKEVCYDD